MWPFFILYGTTFSPSPTNTIVCAHSVLPLALRHGFDRSILTVLGLERSDGAGDGDGGERRWYEGEDR